MVIASGVCNNLLLFTVVYENKARLYTLRMKWQDGLARRHPALNGKFFMLEGELIQDQGHIVEIDVRVFNLLNVTTIVPTATAIANALTAYTALNAMVGLYVATNPNTKGVKTRKICPVPHPLAGLRLLGNEGVTWQQFFGTIYPTILAEGKEAAYNSLIQFMQQLAVGIPSTINFASRGSTSKHFPLIEVHKST